MTDQLKIKVRDIAPTAIRLMPVVKDRLAREAAINGRTLHAEILARLVSSLDGQQGEVNRAAQREGGGGLGHAAMAPQQSDAERSLITAFKRLSPEKQLALLSLLR